MQVAIFKLSHINDPKNNGWTRNQNEVVEPIWTTGDILPTIFADILDHQNIDETHYDELDLNDILDGTTITIMKKLTAMSIVMTNSMTETLLCQSCR